MGHSVCLPLKFKFKNCHQSGKGVAFILHNKTVKLNIDPKHFLFHIQYHNSDVPFYIRQITTMNSVNKIKHRTQ